MRRKGTTEYFSDVRTLGENITILEIVVPTTGDGKRGWDFTGGAIVQCEACSEKRQGLTITTDDVGEIAVCWDCLGALRS